LGMTDAELAALERSLDPPPIKTENVLTSGWSANESTSINRDYRPSPTNFRQPPPPHISLPPPQNLPPPHPALPSPQSRSLSNYDRPTFPSLPPTNHFDTRRGWSGHHLPQEPSLSPILRRSLPLSVSSDQGEVRQGGSMAKMLADWLEESQRSGNANGRPSQRTN